MASRSDYRLLFRNCGKLFCSCSLRSSAIALGWLGIIGNVSQMMMHLMYSERKVVWRLDLLMYSAAFWMVMYKYYKELREHVTPQYGTHFISYNGHEHN
ncbi:hypothetical protein C0J52_22124 [Blattella germanica]|nr:hypothetical protein C0J52_22124 [Blattella germanica]